MTIQQEVEDFLETQSVEREKRDVTNEQEPEDPSETDDVESEKRG
jgi:hypothetical protein